MVGRGKNDQGCSIYDLGGGRNEVQFDPLLPPTYIFFDPQLTPYNIFLTKMLYGGVHARLSMKNLYGGCMQDFLCMQDKGGHTIFSRLPRGAYNIFIPQRILQHFRFQRGAQHFVCVRDSDAFYGQPWSQTKTLSQL